MFGIALIFIIIFIIVCAAAALIDGLIIWGLVHLVNWAFDLGLIFTYWQAFAVGLVIAFIIWTLKQVFGRK